jgi:prefoldin subunit 5
MSGRVPAAPFIAPLSGDMDQRLSQIAQVITLNLQQISVLQQQMTALQGNMTTAQDDITTLQNNAGIVVAPNGGKWQITVNNTGTLSTVSVP